MLEPIKIELARASLLTIFLFLFLSLPTFGQQNPIRANCEILLRLAGDAVRPISVPTFLPIEELSPELERESRHLVSLGSDLTSFLNSLQHRKSGGEDHRGLAQAITEDLSRRGTPTKLESIGMGVYYEIDLVPMGAVPYLKSSYLSRMQRALSKRTNRNVTLGFDTRNIFNELAGRPGAAQLDRRRERIALSMRDLGSRLFAPMGGHEIKHLLAPFDPSVRPHFLVRRNRFPYGSAADRLYGPYLDSEETDLTMPYSIKGLIHRSQQSLRSSERVNLRHPQLAFALKRQADWEIDLARYYTDVFAHLALGIDERYSTLSELPGALTVLRSTETYGYDRRAFVQSDSPVEFRSGAMNEWVQRSGNVKTSHSDASLDSMVVQAALIEERQALSHRVDSVLGAIEGLGRTSYLWDRFVNSRAQFP